MPQTHPFYRLKETITPTLLQTASDCANLNEGTAIHYRRRNHFSLFDKRGAVVIILMDLQSLKGR
ncbi:MULTISPECIES: hypothetical protein [unclassified Bartonella]|uniref:hypothetical protein n=1 Tax=unclassified Bartonella TaxID=2645622 RepID=UPI0035D0397B